jgi:WD40 repeat protein
MLMSKDFRASFWEVGTWRLHADFRAYHASHAKFYLKELKLDEISSEFDVGVLALNDSCGLLVSGLYSGVIQFWDVAKGELFLEIPSHLAEVTALIFNYD